MADEDTNSNLTIYNRDYVDGAGLQATPCGGNCPSKPESAINIGLLSFLDIVQGREGENAKRSLREISNYARVTKACSSHHQSDIWIISVLHQNDGRWKC